jgi:Phytanoyl-CoA dioxygenase (PhyH)
VATRNIYYFAMEIDLQSFERPSAEAIEFFVKQGWVLIDTLNADQTHQLQIWVDEVAAWPLEGGEWIHHREMTEAGPQLARTENFTPFHDGLRALLRTGAMLDVASALIGEEAVLYKEKVNYKLTGGAGFAPHQDAPAYRFIENHISCMVAVDDSTPENGCLDVVSERYDAVLPMDERGCITADVVESMTWIPAPIKAGQTLWFHSRTPHRSGPNTSSKNRRALYPTYNALREGDLRDAYYSQKHREWQEARDRGEKPGLSLIGDFQGVLIDE